MRSIKNFRSAAFAIAIVLAGSQSGLAQTTLNVASTASLFPQYYPLAVGEEHGFFKDEKLTISELATGGGGATIQPVISGDTPIGLASMSGAILAKAKNAPIKVISGVSPNFMSTIVFAVAADSDIKKVADLKGKPSIKIGFTSGGSITDIASGVAVKNENLKDGSEVQRVALGSMQAQAAALLTHQIAVATVNTNTIAHYVVEGKVRIIGDMGDYMKTSEANAIVANVGYIQKNKDSVERFLRAYGKAVDYANSHKDEVLKLYAKKADVSPQVAAIVFGKLTWTTALNYDGFVNELDELKAAGKVPQSMDPKKLYGDLVDLSMLPSGSAKP